MSIRVSFYSKSPSVFGADEVLFSPSTGEKRRRLHQYNVYENQLDEIHDAPMISSSLFQGFYLDNSAQEDSLAITRDAETTRILLQAEKAFADLETDVSAHVQQILQHLAMPSPGSPTSYYRTDLKSVPLSCHQLSQLRRFLVFIRFRNSTGYSTLVEKLDADREHSRNDESQVYQAYGQFVVQIQRRHALRAFRDFLLGRDSRRAEGRSYEDEQQRCMRDGVEWSASRSRKFMSFFRGIMDAYCWRLLDAELCLGVVAEERETGREEFILPGASFGSLDEGFEEDP